MAKRIVKHGNPKVTVKKFTCQNCGCIFVADQYDYSTYFDNRNETYIISDCPECGATVYNFED